MNLLKVTIDREYNNIWFELYPLEGKGKVHLNNIRQLERFISGTLRPPVLRDGSEEFYTPAKEKFNFKNLFNISRKSTFNMPCTLPTTIEDIIDFLIAFEFSIRADAHEISYIDYGYKNEGNSAGYHYPNQTVEDFFVNCTVGSTASHARQLAKAIVDKQDDWLAEYTDVLQGVKTLLAYQDQYPNTSFMQCLLKAQYFHLMGLSINEFPAPTTPIDGLILARRYAGNKSILFRSKRLALLDFFSGCIGKKAYDSGFYNFYYTEFSFFFDANFQLREDGRLSIIPQSTSPGYRWAYVEGERNHDIFQEELLHLANVGGFSFDNPEQDFHERIIFSIESSKRLMQAGLYLEEELLLYALGNPDVFKGYITNCSDFIDAAKNFPQYAEELMDFVLENQDVFKRLITKDADLRNIAEVFPQYAIFRKASIKEATEAYEKSYREIGKNACIIAQSSRGRTGFFNGMPYDVQVMIIKYTMDPRVHNAKQAHNIADKYFSRILQAQGLFKQPDQGEGELALEPVQSHSQTIMSPGNS